MNAVNKAKEDLGLPPSIQAAFQGTAEAFQASLANEPMLILAALVTVYIVLGVLYESYIHPITILSTLPSAGVGALLALFITGSDFSVIALIGIVLLIGIVKKNAIMMIDFALEAERHEGKPPHEAIYQACLLRFRPIMMTTMAALLGGVPLALGTGYGFGTAAAAGHHDCRRLDLQPDADALYDAGDLSLLRPAGGAILAPASRNARRDARRGAGARVRRNSHEHLRTIHSPADRDHAADCGGCAGGRRGVPAAAGVAAAAGGFSDHLGVGVAARRESGDHGVVGGHAARAAVRAHRRGDGDDFVEHAGRRPASRCSSI